MPWEGRPRDGPQAAECAGTPRSRRDSPVASAGLPGTPARASPEAALREAVPPPVASWEPYPYPPPRSTWRAPQRAKGGSCRSSAGEGGGTARERWGRCAARPCPRAATWPCSSPWLSSTWLQYDSFFLGSCLQLAEEGRGKRREERKPASQPAGKGQVVPDLQAEALAVPYIPSVQGQQSRLNDKRLDKNSYLFVSRAAPRARSTNEIGLILNTLGSRCGFL